MPETEEEREPLRKLDDMVDIIFRTTDFIEPRDIAKVVMDEGTDEEIEEWLSRAFVNEIRNILGTRRRAHHPIRVKPIREEQPTANRMASMGDTIRAMWTVSLMDSYSVGNGRWKRLADFTADDCREAAQQRQRTARAAQEWADRFDRLREAMEAAGAATAGELVEAPDGW